MATHPRERRYNYYNLVDSYRQVRHFVFRRLFKSFLPFAAFDLQQRDSDCIERFHDSVNLVKSRLLFFVNLGDCYGFIRFNLDAVVGTPSLL